MASSADPPAWAARVAVEFPAGVSLDGDRLRDRDARTDFELNDETARLLRRVTGSSTALELVRSEPGSWSFLGELNRNHLLNGSREKRSMLDLVAHALTGTDRVYPTHRYPLGGSLARDLSNMTLAVLRIWRSSRWIGPLTLAWSVTVFAGLRLEAALAFPLACLGYLVHECGHALAARLLGGNAYVISEPLGVSVWTRPRSSLQARVFAAAGPVAAFLVGLAILLVDRLTAITLHWAISFPFLVHAVALTPLFSDGRVLLFGAPNLDGGESS